MARFLTSSIALSLGSLAVAVSCSQEGLDPGGVGGSVSGTSGTSTGAVSGATTGGTTPTAGQTSAGSGTGATSGTGGPGAVGGSAAGGSSAGSPSSGAGGGGSTSGGSGAGGGSGSGGSSAGSGNGGSSGGGTDANGCPTGLMGWATVNADGTNGVTGGGNAAPTTVKTFAELKAAVEDERPRVIIVSGTIKTTDGGGSALGVKSNKTVQGADSKATIVGGLEVKGQSNVIIRNLNIQGVWPNSGPDDTLSSRDSHHIWWDHLNVWDAGDGLLDITNSSSYQTVSWSKFWYTNKDHDHRLASLNGSGGGDHPEDWGKLKITYHHNWWSTLVDQRMPRIMYGMGHVFNNFYDAPGNSYCVGVGSYGAALIERNYYKKVNDPHAFMYDVYCHITARDNVYDGTTGKKDTGMGGARKVEGQDFNVVPFTDPPYDYAMDAANDVPTIVTKCAGPR